MKLLIRVIRNKLIRIIQRLDNKNGFIGMLLVMIVSTAIFTVLSSVHIYTIKHAKYQAQIREAFVMQTEMENFAIRIIDAYNRGKLSCPPSPCCPLDGVNFNINLKSGGCGTDPTSNKQEDYECLTSSSKQRYCLVKIESATTISSVLLEKSPPPPTTGTTMSVTAAENKQQNLKNKCLCSPSTTNNYRSDPDCQVECRKIIAGINKNEYPSPSGSLDIKKWVGHCCDQKLFTNRVINCNTSRASDCSDYESSTLSDSNKMYCEICEQADDNSKTTESRIFTYYVCPAANPETEIDKRDKTLEACRSKLTTSTSDVEKGKSGVFYQTFRLLTH